MEPCCRCSTALKTVCFSSEHIFVLLVSEDYQELIEDIVRDGRLYASENHQEILKVCGRETFLYTDDNVQEFLNQTSAPW